jgi:N-acyl-D-aspartate/D-glutamate deacylase
MTGRPAAVFGLRDRGLLRAGMAADVVVFDPAVIADKGTYREPAQHPDGIKHVFVNGRAAVLDGKLRTGKPAGKVLRRQA